MDQVASGMAVSDRVFMGQDLALAAAVIVALAMGIPIVATRHVWLIQAITARPQSTDQHRSIAQRQSIVLPIQPLPAGLSRSTKTQVVVANEGTKFAVLLTASKMGRPFVVRPNASVGGKPRTDEQPVNITVIHEESYQIHC